MTSSSSLNQADGIHQTGEGYCLIVERVFPTLEPCWRETGEGGFGSKKGAGYPAPLTHTEKIRRALYYCGMP
jgi:hypothetical protein